MHLIISELRSRINGTDAILLIMFAATLIFLYLALINA